MQGSEAKERLWAGRFVKLPEWNGFWFMRHDKIHVFTFDGRVVNTPQLDLLDSRDDWELTDGSRNIGSAIQCIKSPRSLAKSIHRKSWGVLRVELTEGGELLFMKGSNRCDTWHPTMAELLATDYIVHNDDILGLDDHN